MQKTFTRRAWWALLAIFIVMLGGRLVARYTALGACPGWPLCLPVSAAAWAQLWHRASVAAAGLLVAWLLVETWRTQRDHRLLLPLTAVVATLFLAQAFVGAMLVVRGYPLYLSRLHQWTALSLWGGVLALAAAAWYALPDGVAFPPVDWRQRLRDLLTLTKPVVVALLLVTTFAGMVVAARGLPQPRLLFWTLLAGYLAAGGSSALNQYIDRDLDRNMQRTARRPLAAQRLTPAEGLAFGLALSLLSFYLMAAFVNLTAALLTLAGIFYYVGLYSLWLKKATVQNIVIGGGAGAIPPLVGWSAVTGGLDWTAAFLFAIIFLWTPPHFWALAIVRRKDYARAGVPMLPVVQGERAARRQILIYTVELVALTLLMPLVGLAGGLFLVAAALLGAWLLWTAWQVWTREGNKIAWKMYRYTSMYLLFLFAALMADAVW